jgi:hypothetical protein
MGNYVTATPGELRDRGHFADSGADSVVLQPIHRNEEDQIERIGQYLLRRRDSPVLASSS